ncbi:hypothetical protein BGZ73_003019 [Actinomortierella ambigua]|nr:hypothetical protein BGZ73_003019 [Actinomortierella ambigua]
MTLIQRHKGRKSSMTLMSMAFLLSSPLLLSSLTHSSPPTVADALNLNPLTGLTNSWKWIAKRAVAKNGDGTKSDRNPVKSMDVEEAPFIFPGAGLTMGQWDLTGLTGVSAMHGTLIPNTNKAVFLEKAEKTINARLPENPDKYAYTVEYDLDQNTFRALHTKTNMFCSAGGYRPDGTIVSLGGAEKQNDLEQGWNSLRFLSSCTADKNSKCDWDTRDDLVLKAARWYPTVETLADGRLFIIGGATRGASLNSEDIAVPTWELYPPLPNNPTHFDFLDQTLPYNLYPMVHLLPDGNLFIFANQKSVIFSTKTWEIIKTLPDIPGAPRNYPLTGGSVLLPLRPENNYEPEILLCGGSTDFSSHGNGNEYCGRIQPLTDNPQWKMERMPVGRVMPDVTLLHDGSVLILNGARRGTAGYGRARDPVLQPLLYKPWDTEADIKEQKKRETKWNMHKIKADGPTKERSSTRFTFQRPSFIPRVYHSIALQMIDGRVLVAGSNPNANTMVEGEFPVEYRLEMFSPGYLFSETPRPFISGKNTVERTVKRPPAARVEALQAAKKSPEQGIGDGDLTENLIHYDQVFELEVQFFAGKMTNEHILTRVGSQPRKTIHGVVPPRVQVTILNAGFVTHSTHMSQRLVSLEIVGYIPSSDPAVKKDILKVKGPKNSALAPPGYYQMSLVENGVPSMGMWVRVASTDK